MLHGCAPAHHSILATPQESIRGRPLEPGHDVHGPSSAATAPSIERRTSSHRARIWPARPGRCQDRTSAAASATSPVVVVPAGAHKAAARTASRRSAHQAPGSPRPAQRDARTSRTKCGSASPSARGRRLWPCRRPSRRRPPGTRHCRGTRGGQEGEIWRPHTRGHGWVNRLLQCLKFAL